MWLIRLAWKNIWRNKSRTMISLSAIFFAVILSTVAESVKKGVFDNLIRNVVSFYTGYIQIHKEGYQDEQILDNALQESAEREKIILNGENISSFTKRIESYALASSGDITKGCMIIGIDAKGENSITRLSNKVIKGNYIEENDNGVMLGKELAERLRLTINDTLVLLGQGYHGSMAAGKYPVRAILKFGSPQLNERLLYMSLPAAQSFFSAEGMITSYVIALKNEKLLDETASALRKRLEKETEVLTWEEMLPEIRQHIETDTSNMKIVQWVLYLLICFGIFSTMLMMLMERTYEFGMLISIGMKKSKLIILLLMESVLTVVTGCVLGIIFSIPLIYYFYRHPIRMGKEMAQAYERFGFEAIIPASMDPGIFISQTITVLFIGLILALYPSVKILRLRPTEAFKR